MIDTLQLHYSEMSYDVYQRLYQGIQRIAAEYGKPFYRTRNSTPITSYYKTTCLINYGIMEMVLMRSSGCTRWYMLSVRLRPKLLLDQNDFHNITKFDECLAVRKKFNCLMGMIANGIPDFYDWKCYRIDYAVIIKTSHVNDYIETFKRGNIHKAFSNHIESMMEYHGSFYLSSNKNSVTINFYDKYDQAQTAIKYKTWHNFKDVSLCKNQLRLEVQCRIRKLNNLKLQYGLFSSTVRSFLRPDIARDVILKYYDMITMDTDYSFTTYPIAKQFLCEKCTLKPEKIQSICDYLYIINDCRGLWELKKRYSIKESRFYRIINDIKNTGINPVLIPENCKIIRLPSLRGKIKKALYQQTPTKL